jgi:hypothetical protein
MLSRDPDLLGLNTKLAKGIFRRRRPWRTWWPWCSNSEESLLNIDSAEKPPHPKSVENNVGPESPTTADLDTGKVF